MGLFCLLLLSLSMVLINDSIPLGNIIRFTPLRIGGMLSPDPRGGFGKFGDRMAYEDVIPVEYFTPGAASEVIDLLVSWPIHGEDRVRVFISWSKDVGYKYTVEDLDILR